MEARISLMELLEGIHDPRRARGKRHPLPALLGLAVVAMLAGMTSYEAIVQYGKERGWEFLQHLGFTTRWGLCKATYSRVFRRIDVADFEARVGAVDPGAARAGRRPAHRHRRQDRTGQSRRRHARGPLGVRLCPGRQSGLGPTSGGCQDQRAQSRAGTAGCAAGQGQGRHRRRHVHAPRCVRGGARRGRRLRPARKGEPTDALQGHRGRFCRARGRPFPPSRPRGARPRSSAPVRSTRGMVGSRRARSR